MGGLTKVGERKSLTCRSPKWGGHLWRATKLVYAAGITVLAVTAIVSPRLGERIRYKLTNDPMVFGRYAGEVTAHRSQRVRSDTLVILGDSIARGLNGLAFYSGPSVNFGIGGDTVVGVLRRSKTYDLKPVRRVILLVGVNDLSIYSNEQIVREYRKLLDFLADKKTVICAVLPLNEPRFRPAAITMINGKKADNARICQLNRQLEELAANKRNIRFCNPGPLLSDSNGNLHDRLTHDGIHLNEKGYEILHGALMAALADE